MDLKDIEVWRMAQKLSNGEI